MGCHQRGKGCYQRAVWCQIFQNFSLFPFLNTWNKMNKETQGWPIVGVSRYASTRVREDSFSVCRDVFVIKQGASPNYTGFALTFFVFLLFRGKHLTTLCSANHLRFFWKNIKCFSLQLSGNALCVYSAPLARSAKPPTSVASRPTRSLGRWVGRGRPARSLPVPRAALWSIPRAPPATLSMPGVGKLKHTHTFMHI